MLTLHLPLKPYSVNKYFYGNRSIKRKEAREWELQVLECLRKPETQSNIEKFKNKFNPLKNTIEIYITCQYPKEVLYTKKGHLSSRAFDISNTEKPLIDVIFLNKYSTETTKNIEIDDKYITKMTSEKIAGKDYKITVNIQLKNL